MKTTADRNRINAPRRVSWMTLGVVLTLWTAACGGDGPTGPSTYATPAGEFTLNMIESQTLPYMWYSDTGYTLEIMSGSISIKSDGKWVSKITSKETVDGFASTYNDSTFGTWTQANGATTASLLNTESNVTSSATWTSTDVTVTEVEGTVSRKITYRRN